MSDLICVDKETGELRAIYSDQLLPYIERLKAELGLPDTAVKISRATHVEPDPQHLHGGNWSVDLEPSGGPLVHVDEKGQPFIKRDAAMQFERRWLTNHWLRS